MKLISDICEGVKGIGLIIIIVAFSTIIPLGVGCITYFLLSVAFPEYIIFGWYWWRFFASGLLLLIVI